MNKKQLLNYLTQLVSFKTDENTLSEQMRCLRYIKEQCSFFPFTIKEYMSGNKPSMVLTTKKTKHPKLFLVAHIDVISGNDSLFQIKKEKDIVRGRGVSDMKFAIATYIVVLQELYAKYHRLPSLGIMLTADEEIEGNNGVGFLLQQENFSCDVAFLPDGGDSWHIVQESRGLLQILITCVGKSSHGSTPWNGKSAITTLFSIGETLQRMYPSVSAQETVVLNFGKIIGGNAINQVADTASLWLDFRFTKNSSVATIMHQLSQTFPEVQITIIDNIPPFYLDSNNPYIQKWSSIIQSKSTEGLFISENGATDAPYFSEKNIPTIVSKPIGGNIHGDDEWISISSLLEFTQILKKYIETLF